MCSEMPRGANKVLRTLIVAAEEDEGTETASIYFECASTTMRRISSSTGQCAGMIMASLILLARLIVNLKPGEDHQTTCVVIVFVFVIPA